VGCCYVVDYNTIIPGLHVGFYILPTLHCPVPVQPRIIEPKSTPSYAQWGCEVDIMEYMESSLGRSSRHLHLIFHIS